MTTLLRVKRPERLNGKATKRSRKGAYAYTYTRSEAENMRQRNQTGKNSKVKVFTPEEIAAYIEENK